MPPKKLTINQEREIIRRHASGELQENLAKHFGISQSMVSRCVNCNDVKLSAEQEFEAAGRLLAFTESDQELASYYGVNVSEIRRIKERPRSAEYFTQCFEDRRSVVVTTRSWRVGGRQFESYLAQYHSR